MIQLVGRVRLSGGRRQFLLRFLPWSAAEYSPPRSTCVLRQVPKLKGSASVSARLRPSAYQQFIHSASDAITFLRKCRHLFAWLIGGDVYDLQRVQYHFYSFDHKSRVSANRLVLRRTRGVYRNTAGETPKRLASAFTWRVLSSRLPFRMADTMLCPPNSSARSVCLRLCSSIR